MVVADHLKVPRSKAPLTSVRVRDVRPALYRSPTAEALTAECVGLGHHLLSRSALASDENSPWKQVDQTGWFLCGPACILLALSD